MNIIWTVMLGLGVFLYGITQLEIGIKQISGDRLRQWIGSSTRWAASSALSGAVVTALLQSSSMVSLLVLAFASAGTIPLYNAIGVILGANVGTTITGWLVTTVGFKLPLQAFAVPLIGLGSLGQVLLPDQRFARKFALCLFGMGLLIFGLGLMKDAVADLPQQWDVANLSGLHAGWYLLIGIVVSALIQSSSATMMLALSALYGGLFELSAAAAVVIGANLGTTSTVILGSLTGSNIKKQLALAHCSFNVVVSLIAFFLLLPMLPWLLALAQIESPLYGLVAFHSLFNMLGLLIFLPVLKNFSNWVSKFFAEGEPRRLIGIPADVPEAALPAIDQAVRELVVMVVALNLHNFKLEPRVMGLKETLANQLDTIYREPRGFEQRYDDIKQREEDIAELAIAIHQQTLNDKQARQISLLMEATRATVYASKALKDVRENLIALRHSENRDVQRLYRSHSQFLLPFYHKLLELLWESYSKDYLEEEKIRLRNLNDEHQQFWDDAVYDQAGRVVIYQLPISTLLNVNRAIHHSGNSLLRVLELNSELRMLEQDKV